MSHRGIDLDISERLKNKCAVLNVPFPKNEELAHIFGSILSQHLLSFGEHIKVLGKFSHKITRIFLSKRNLGKLMVEATVELHKSMKLSTNAIMDNPQSFFSLKTLSQVRSQFNSCRNNNFKCGHLKVIQGLLLSNKEHHNTQNAMCRLWVNEVHLAYGARLREKRCEA
jgi:uncharacterized protein YjhX (UPF0386 family)